MAERSDAVLVVADPARAEHALAAGQMDCPGCGGRLRPYGYARTRTVRGLGARRLTHTPRRARCAGCSATHVLLPTELSVRRADATEVIGAALVARATGQGYRAIAARFGRPVSTVRAWLRAVDRKHANWLWRRASEQVTRIDRDLADDLSDVFKPALWQAMNLFGGAARRQRERGCPDSLWALIGLFARGRLLAPPRGS